MDVRWESLGRVWKGTRERKVVLVGSVRRKEERREKKTGKGMIGLAYTPLNWGRHESAPRKRCMRREG